MSVANQSVPAVESAARALAMELTGALRQGIDNFCLQRCLDGGEKLVNGLGAVRALGADVLAPFVMAGRRCSATDAGLIRAAVGVFPAPPPGTEAGALWNARDTALVQALTALGVETSGWEGLAAGHDDDGGAGHALGAEPRSWVDWSAGLVRLSPLALPPVRGPLRDQARRRRVDLARALVRALLRRDHLSAARLARWLALDAGQVPEEPLLASALKHITVLSDDQPRALLETAITRRLLEGGA